MILSIKVSNFLSIRDEQELVFLEGPDQISESYGIHNVDNKRFNVLKSAAIYGANASGKSNFINALHFMKSFITEGANKLQTGDNINFKSFLLDENKKNEPSFFEVNFLHKETKEEKFVRYQYGFVVDKNKVHQEWLYAYPNNRAQTWFTREEQTWDFKKPCGSQKLNTIIKEQTGENILFLSRAGGQQNHLLLKNIFQWFKEKLCFITPELIQNDPLARKFVLDLLTHSDLGIGDMHVRVDEKINLIHISKLKNHIPFKFDEEESSGTQKLFELAGPWYGALKEGGVLLIDEFGSSLHPLLAKELIKLFNSDYNENHAQLIFATHDTHIMAPNILRHDQIWFAEKNEGGASKYYSLWDYRPSKGENIEKGYLMGRYV